MQYVEEWIQETIMWADPWGENDPGRSNLHVVDDFVREAIGATSDQTRKHTNSAFALWRYVPPAAALHFIDPFFDPRIHGRDSVDWLCQQIDAGRAVAPAQVWVSASEAAYFPKLAWFDERERVLRNLKFAKREPTISERNGLVIQHEGRHRLWVAHHVYDEKLVPVQLWVELKSRESELEIKKLQQKIERLEREAAWNEDG